jgi:hypothetical protein
MNKPLYRFRSAVTGYFLSALQALKLGKDRVVRETIRAKAKAPKKGKGKGKG